jgi:hypothetical protein
MLFRFSSIKSACIDSKLTEFLISILHNEEYALLIVGRLVVHIQTGFKILDLKVTFELLLFETVHLSELCNVQVECYI